MSESILPRDWIAGVFSDIAEVNPTVTVADLCASTPVSFLTMADVSENGRILNHQIRPLREVRAGFTRFEEDDVLFAKITPCMQNGKGAFARELSNYHGFGSTEFHVLRATELGDAEFIYHLAQSSEVRNKAMTFFTGSAGQQRVDSKFFRCFPLLIPPLPQQRKIARILTTLDNVITQTEALIAKYQAIKQGLMHDLFTRGVDATGKLRPPQSEAPELYKQSALGWIPKEWEVQTLDALVSPNRPIAYGILMPGYGHPGGVPVIKVKDIKAEKIDESDLLLTSPEIDFAYRRSRVKEGDMLFTIRGTVGRTAIVPSSLEGANITQDTARIGIVVGDAQFVRNYLKMPVPSQFISCNTLGVAVQGINLRDVRRIPTAFPSLTEQQKLGNLIATHDGLIDREKDVLRKLAKKKTGLMQDLLTGRVPVKADEPEEITP